MSWDLNTEKLLCLIVLDDGIAQKVFADCADGFFRAFVVQNRKTGQVKMKYRFNWASRGKSWWEMSFPEWSIEVILPKLSEIVMRMVSVAAVRADIPLTENAVQFFEPPDDGGDPAKVIEWLIERDLIAVAKVDAPEN